MLRSALSTAPADILIIGAGIAGASLAWWAARAGRSVTLIDSGGPRASAVPTALINPVRGLQGRLIKHGPEGAACTFAVIAALRAAGHVVAGEHGLWRPVPDAALRATWSAQLPADFPHRWHDQIPAGLGLAGAWHSVLELPDSGWVDGPALVRALVTASGARAMQATVSAIDIERQAATLSDGRIIAGRMLVWCGGAAGARSLGVTATYKPGSVVLTRAPLVDRAVSHGLYATPCGAGSAVGPSTEGSATTYPEGPAPDAVMDRLHARAAAMFAGPVDINQTWRGVRLARADFPRGLKVLGPFGSRGFLLAPLQARRFVEHEFGASSVSLAL